MSSKYKARAIGRFGLGLVLLMIGCASFTITKLPLSDVVGSVISEQVTQEGFQLTNIDYYKSTNSASDNKIWKMVWTFEDVFGVAAPIILTFAPTSTPTNSATYVKFSQPVQLKPIQYIKVCQDSGAMLLALQIYHTDSTSSLLPGCTCDSSKTKHIIGTPNAGFQSTSTTTPKFNGRLVGMEYLCSGTFQITFEKIKVYVNNDVCSAIEVTYPGSLPTNMTITSIPGAASQTLSALTSMTNTGGTTCGTTYTYSLMPSPTILSISGTTLSGTATSSADIQITTMTLRVNLSPYMSKLMTFTLTVSCSIEAPVISASSVIYEIGIVTPPTSFSQTAATQSCGVVATLTSLPSATFVSLSPNSVTGGSILVDPAVSIGNVGTYTLKLTNPLGLFATMTLIIKDPCSRAVIQTTPNPFTDQIVNVPSSTLIPVSISSLTTDLASIGITCNLKATITTSYLPVSVAAPYSQYQINPAQVVLPTDTGIGPSSTHVVVFQISSLTYTTVTPVSFNLNVIVTCQVTSLTIQTTVTDFSYILNTETVTKGPYSALQVSACQQPVTWTMTGTHTGGSFSSNQYSFSFTDPALIGTTQTYVLTATIPQIDTGTGFSRFATSTLNVNIICSTTSISFSTQPSNIFIQSGITNQPQSSNFAIIQTPACGFSPTFALVGTAPNVSLTGLTSTGGSLEANGETISNKGVYTLHISATIGGITQNSASFNVTIQDPCEAAVFPAASPFSNMSLIRDFANTDTQTFVFKTDIETTYPIVCGFTSTLTSGQSYVSISGSTITVGPVNQPNTDIGPQTISVRITSLLYSQTATYSFTLTLVECVVTNVNLPSNSNQVYMLNNPQLNFFTSTATWTPACNFIPSYSAAFVLNSASVQKPASVGFDNISAFTVLSSLPADVGIYTVTITASVGQVIPPSPAATATSSFTLTIESDCVNTSINALSMTNMSIIVPGSTSQSIDFTNTKSIVHPTSCGPYSFVWSPSLPSYLTVDSATKTLTLATNNVNDQVTALAMTLTVKLTDYPLVQSVIENFTVTITCQVTSISFSTQPSNIFIQPGITNQPQSSNFAIIQTPACGFSPTFALVGTAPNVSLTGLTSTGGSLEANGETISNKGVYTLHISATIGGITQNSASFNVTIQDPCEAAVFPAASPFSNMSLIRDFANTDTQTFVFKTDIETTYPIVCGFTATLTSGQSYVSISGSTITVGPVNQPNTDIGPQTISVRIASLLYSQTATYSFTLTLVECVVTNVNLPLNSNQVYMLNNPQLNFSTSTATWTPACNFIPSYSAAFVLNSASVQKPASVGFDNISAFTVLSSLPADVGIYTVTITASVGQVTPPSPAATATSSFTLTIESDCVNTSINALSMTNMSIIVPGSTSQSIDFTNTKSIVHPTSCGPYSFVWSPSLPSYLTVDSATKTLTLATNNVNDQVTALAMTLTVKLTDYPLVQSVIENFTVTITCQVTSISFSTQPSNIFIQPGITNQPQSSNFAIIQTPACGFSPTFALVGTVPNVSLTGLTSVGGSLEANGETISNKGVYTLQISSTIGTVTGLSAQFTLTIQDPCEVALLPTNNPFTSMTFQREIADSQTLTFDIRTDIEQLYSTIVCGFTATLISTQSYVSIIGNTITAGPVYAPNTDIGAQTVTIQVSSPNYIQTQTYSFTLTITCTVTSIAFITQPSNIFIEPGITIQPQLSNFAIAQTPACGEIATFTLVGTAPNISLTGLTSSGGSVQANGENLSNLGDYTLQVNATVGGVTLTSTQFVITIKDPCARAVFPVSNPFSSMTLIRNFDSIVTQVFSIKTDVETLNSTIVCAQTITLVSPPGFMSLSGSSLVATESLTIATDVGPHVITVQAESTLYNSTVTPVQYTLSIDIYACEVTSITIPSILDFTYTLGSGQKQIPFSAASWSSLACSYTPTYTMDIVFNTASINPTWITLQTSFFDVNDIVPTDAGVYTVTLTATISQPPAANIFAQTQFALTLINGCEFTALIPPIIANQTIEVNMTSIPIDVWFGDTWAQTLVFASYCGARSYTISSSPALPTSLILSIANDSLSASSSSLADVGIYEVTITASLQSWLSVGSQSATFTLNVSGGDFCSTTSFYGQKLPNLSVFEQDPMTNLQQTINFSEFQYQALQDLNFDCGRISKIVYFLGTTTSPTWAEAVGTQINIKFDQFGAPGTIDLVLSVYLENYPNVTIKEPFSVSLSSSDLKCNPSINQVYMYGRPPLQFSVTYQNITVNKGIQLTTTKNPVALDSGGKELAFPSFVSYDSVTNMFTAGAVEPKDFGSYLIGLKIGYTEFPKLDIVCTAKLQVNYEVTFTGPEIPQQKFLAGQTWKLQIPQYTDAFGQKATVIGADFRQGSKLFTFDSAAGIIMTSTDVDTSTMTTSDFTIKITLQDSVGGQSTVSFQVTMQSLVEWVTKEVSATFVPQTKQVQLNPPKPYIKFINQVGRLRVAFTQPIIIPTFELYPEFTKTTSMRQNCSDPLAIKGLCIENLNSHSRRMLLTQKEQTLQAVDIVNRGLVMVNNTYMPVINLKMKPGIESNIKDLNFTWSCVDFQPSFIDFQVNYQLYQSVSIHEYKDLIEVDINGVQYFRSAINNQHVESIVAQMEQKVPLQMDPSGSSGMVGAAAAIGNSSKAIVVFNFLINLLLGGAMSQLFQAIRKLTIMVHLLVINVQIPAGCQIFFSSLLNFVTFNIIDLVPQFRKWLDLQDEDAINDNLASLGYPSSYFVINIGNVLLGMLYFIILFIFYAVTKNSKHPQVLKIKTKLTNGLFWSEPIQFVTETYMIFAVCTFTNLLAFKFTTYGVTISTNLTMIALIFLLGLPIFALYILLKNRKKLGTPKMKNTYLYLYDTLAWKKRGTQVLFEPFVFYVRILVLAASLLFMQSLRTFQLIIAIGLSVFILIYVGLAEPYTTREKTFFEQFNEFFIAIIIYHLMCFADTMPDIGTRTTMGWSMVVAICVNLLINFAFIIYSAVKDAYQKLRFKYYTHKRDKLMKQAAERRHAALMESASNSLIGNSLIEVTVKKNGKRTQNEGLRTPDEWIILRDENSKSKTEKRQKKGHDSSQIAQRFRRESKRSR